jgi:hypothetical protein
MKQKMQESISPVFGRHQDQSEQSELSFILNKPILVASLNTSVVTSEKDDDIGNGSEKQGSRIGEISMNNELDAEEEIYLSLSMPPDLHRKDEGSTPELNKLKANKI